MIPAGLIRVRRREHYARSDDLLAGLRQLTKPMFSATKLRVIRDPASHPKFAELEEKLVRGFLMCVRACVPRACVSCARASSVTETLSRADHKQLQVRGHLRVGGPG
jgi:hypothetical protein